MSRDAAAVGPGQPPSTATVGADETPGSSVGSDPFASVESGARCRTPRLGDEIGEAVRDAGQVDGVASGLAVGGDTRGRRASGAVGGVAGEPNRRQCEDP